MRTVVRLVYVNENKSTKEILKAFFKDASEIVDRCKLVYVELVRGENVTLAIGAKPDEASIKLTYSGKTNEQDYQMIKECLKRKCTLQAVQYLSLSCETFIPPVTLKHRFLEYHITQ